MTPRELLRSVQRRSIELLIAADGNIDYSTAERAAAKEIAAAERLKPKTATPSFNRKAGARERLASALSAIASRMSSAAAASIPLPSSAVQPTASTTKQREPKLQPTSSEEPASDYPLLFAGNVTGAQLIPDSEYAPSLHDLPTANWRASIEANERRKQAREAL